MPLVEITPLDVKSAWIWWKVNSGDWPERG